jgi:hypothetical protein
MGKKRATLSIAALAASMAFGQAVPENDPPSRAARLSYVTGTVSFQPGGAEEWVPAPLNRPITTGDKLWTEGNARAELHIGSAALRLNRRTSFSFLNLNDTTAQIQVSAGTLAVRLRRLNENESFEIDTPQAAFSLLRPGEYRVDVNDAGDTSVLTIRGGEGEAVISGNRVIHLRPRTQVRITTVPGDVPPTIDERDVPVADPFDNFCSQRDRKEDQSESVRHVSREVPGIADLDEHGAWREDPQYGWIWVPRVEAGWAPYHTGHWAWIAPWGWTWVDDASWGYAPFHYGRWAFVADYWVWVPGPPAVRPVYAPALVAFVGGPRFSLSLAIGGGAAAVGWFPLAPGEVWIPAYQASPRYFTQVNVSNTVVNKTVNITNVYNTTYVNKTVVNNTYVNQHVNGAVTAVSQSAMTSGRPVAKEGVRVPANALEAAQVQHVAPVAPQRAALLSGASASAAAPPAGLNSRAVMARATPPAAPLPFAQQQTALQANPGQPLSRPLAGTPPAERPAIRQLQARPVTPIAQSATPRPPAQVERPVHPQVERPMNPVPAEHPPAHPQVVTKPQGEPRPLVTEPKVNREKELKREKGEKRDERKEDKRDKKE